MASSLQATIPTDRVIPIGDFVQECHRFIPSGVTEPVSYNIVIGNPAGDADSILSAITLAYIKSLWGTTTTSFTTLTESTRERNPLWIPVLSIPRHDLQTQRPETLFLLRAVGIDVERLWCVTDLSQILSSEDAASGEGRVHNVALVDHNRYQHTVGQVVEIWDHHLDEGFHTDTCQQRHIAFANGTATVASTGTLVGEQLFALGLETFPVDLSFLLLGLILLDSINLSVVAGKVTDRDMAVVQTLLRRTEWRKLEPMIHPFLQNDDLPDTTALFDALQGAKFDLIFWKQLSVRDALRLDYKQFTAAKTSSVFGMSTVLLPLEDFLIKEDAKRHIFNYMTECNVETLVIMLAYSEKCGDAKVDSSKSATLKRQLVVCSIRSPLFHRLVDFLVSEGSLQLQYRDGPFDDGDLFMQCFDQKNGKASRKQVAPILLDLFQQGLP